MSTVDKFGRAAQAESVSCSPGKRGPPGHGYKTDSEGNYLLENKRLKMNLLDPMTNSEAVNLSTLRKYSLHKMTNDGSIDAGGRPIKHVGLVDEPTSVVTKAYLLGRYPMSVKQDKQGTVLLCGDKRLVKVRDGIDPQDAVTLGQVDKYVEVLRKRISEEIKDAIKTINDSLAAKDPAKPVA